MNKITAKQLVRINGTVTARKKVPVTEEQMKKIEDVANSPYVQDEKFFFIYKTTIEKASKLGCEIFKIKPFDKGNRDTALLALLTLLDVNGFKLKDYQNDLIELNEYVKKYDLTATNSWIMNHLEDNPFVKSAIITEE